MPLYGYNYPWSGRLGRVATCCLYCGESGNSWTLSSAAVRCMRCSPHSPIKPELERDYRRKFVAAARAWCDEHGVDYEKTIVRYYDELGPPLQARAEPIPGADEDYTVYREKSDNV